MDNLFIGYMTTSELDNIVDECVARYSQGEDDFDVDVPRELSASEMAYIKREVSRRIGL